MTYPQNSLRLLEAELRCVSVERSCAKMLISDIVAYLRRSDCHETAKVMEFIENARFQYERIELEQKESLSRERKRFGG